MRVIKFRGKRADTGEWVYGDLLTMGGRAFIASMYQWDSCDDPRDFVSMHEVLPETVGQITGLKDKDGREIFSGDILLEDCPRGYKYQVLTVPGGFAINQFQDELKAPLFFESLADMQNNSYVSGNCSVIGNVFDTPELLKGGKDE